MPHISVLSSVLFLLTIITYCGVFICIVSIPFGNGSYASYTLPNIIYQNDNPDYGIFAVLYKNEMKIEKMGKGRYNKGDDDTIISCSYQEIQSSENHSCGNFNGINNTNQIIQIINKINSQSNSNWIMVLILIILNIIIGLSVYKLIFSITSKTITQQEFELNYQNRKALFKYFKLAFLFSFIHNWFLFSKFSDFNNFFNDIPGVSYQSSNDTYTLCLVSIVYNCLGVTEIISDTIINLASKNGSAMTYSNNSDDKPSDTPGGEEEEKTPLKTYKKNKITLGV